MNCSRSWLRCCKATQERGQTARPPAPQWPKLRQQTNGILAELDTFPLPPDLVMAVRESRDIADCEVNIHGDAQQLGPKIPRGVVQVASKPGEKLSVGPAESGRLQLAAWLAGRDNPLTARVAVNRIWQNMFGRGLVATVDNFGAMGEKPSNQEQLDYLAARFMDQGWSIKKIIREIALSRAYRLGTAYQAKNDKIDPDNVLLWRMNRRRLEAEAIRDSLLMISGQIDLHPPAESPVQSFKRGFDIGRGARDYAAGLRCVAAYAERLRPGGAQLLAGDV